MALSSEQIARIKQEADTQERLGTEASRNAFALWHSQLNMALEAGDEETVRQLVSKSAVAGAWSSGDDNCGCAKK